MEFKFPQHEEELIMLTSALIEKKATQYLLAKVILYTPNEIKSYWKYVKKLYLSTVLCYTSKPGYERFSF